MLGNGVTVNPSEGRVQKPQARKLSVGGVPPPPGPPRTRFCRKVSGKKLTNDPFPKTEIFSPKTAFFAQKTPFLGQFLMDFFLTERRGTPHSGPGGRRINLSKCTKNQAKSGNSTLNIAFPKTRIIFNESPQKNYFWPFLHFWPCQGSLWAIGAKKRPAERPNGHLPEN